MNVRNPKKIEIPPNNWSPIKLGTSVILPNKSGKPILLPRIEERLPSSKAIDIISPVIAWNKAIANKRMANPNCASPVVAMLLTEAVTKPYWMDWRRANTTVAITVNPTKVPALRLKAFQPSRKAFVAEKYLAIMKITIAAIIKQTKKVALH